MRNEMYYNDDDDLDPPAVDPGTPRPDDLAPVEPGKPLEEVRSNTGRRRARTNPPHPAVVAIACTNCGRALHVRGLPDVSDVSTREARTEGEAEDRSVAHVEADPAPAFRFDSPGEEARLARMALRELETVRGELEALHRDSAAMARWLGTVRASLSYLTTVGPEVTAETREYVAHLLADWPSWPEVRR